MDRLNYEALERIPIPEGLEERLSAKIDEWEQKETKQKAQRRRLPSALRYMAVAASVALVLGVGLHLMRQDKERIWPSMTPTKTPCRHNRRPSAP